MKLQGQPGSSRAIDRIKGVHNILDQAKDKYNFVFVDTGQFARGETTLRLEGRVSGEWVRELQKSCDVVLSTGSPLRWTCLGLRLSTTVASRLLKDMLAAGVKLVNCTPFVAIQLNLKPEDEASGKRP